MKDLSFLPVSALFDGRWLRGTRGTRALPAVCLLAAGLASGTLTPSAPSDFIPRQTQNLRRKRQGGQTALPG